MNLFPLLALTSLPIPADLLIGGGGPAFRGAKKIDKPGCLAPCGRNEPCYCGSGKKYKKCCLKIDSPPPRAVITPGNDQGFARTSSTGFVGVGNDRVASTEREMFQLQPPVIVGDSGIVGPQTPLGPNPA